MPGDLLRALRSQRGLTQEKLAYQAGITAKTLWRIEAGEIPRVETMRKIAGVLEVSVPEAFPSMACPHCGGDLSQEPAA